MAESNKRAFKKARTSGPIDAKRVKGSPRPLRTKKMSKAPSDLQPVTAKAKGKGKEKEVVSKPRLPKLSGEDASHDALPSTFKIIAGSYEKLLYGLEGTVTTSESDQDSEYSFNLKPMFIFPAHVSCIKAVAASPTGGKWLATGSADEIVKVWDLRRRKEIGGLMHHEGSITHLSFPSRSHLLSASEDGTLCLFRARDWAVLRSLHGHKGRVNSVAVHPSGKVALSVGKDRTLRMWDLMRGKGSASTKLGKEGELVRWNNSGSLFVVQSQATIDVYSTQMALLHTITHPSRLHDIKFCKRVNGKGDVLLVGAEDQKLSVYQISDDPESTNPPAVIAEMVGHANRVKAVETLSIALPQSLKSKRTSTTIICTISSDGKIFVYDMASLPEPSSSSSKIEITPKAEYDTKGTRLTCVTVAEGDVATESENGKRKRTATDEVGEDDEKDNEEAEDEEGWSLGADEVEEEGEEEEGADESASEDD